DRLEPDAGALRRRAGNRGVAGLEGPPVAVAVHERVDRVAVRGDGRELDRAELVLDPPRLDRPTRAPLDGLPVRRRGVRHRERDVLDAVAVAAAMPRDIVVLAQRRGDDDADAPLLEDVRGAVADPGLRTGVRGAREAERVLVEVRGLLRVA